MDASYQFHGPVQGTGNVFGPGGQVTNTVYQGVMPTAERLADELITQIAVHRAALAGGFDGLDRRARTVRAGLAGAPPDVAGVLDVLPDLLARAAGVPAVLGAATRMADAVRALAG